MKFHPYSEVFPLLEGAQFDELVADIKIFGLREKIWTYNDKILDGRNRYLACQKAKKKPEFRAFRGTEAGALALVVSANIARRHLNPSQLAMAAARIATARAGDNQHSEVGSIETTSKLVGASKGSTKRARKVLDQGSAALVEAVDRGEVAVSRAAAVTDLPKPQQLAAAKAKPEPEPAEDWAPEIGEDERLAAIEREQAATLDKLLAADDRLGHALEELKRKDAEIAVLKLSRDGYQNQCGELVRRLKRLQSKLDRLEKQAA